MSELGQIVYLLNKYKFLESKLISTKFEFKNFEIACFYIKFTNIGGGVHPQPYHGNTDSGIYVCFLDPFNNLGCFVFL